MSTIGEKIRQLRKERDITQGELASYIHVNRATLANWEVGRATPDVASLKKIADYFSISIDDIIGRNPQNTHLPPDAWEAGPMVRVPILGEIRAGEPIFADEHIEGWEIAPADEVKDGQYFYLRVKGDSMIGSRIHEGDLVLVRQQEEVETGQIAVVNIDGENATLKRVYHTNGQLILQPDNPKYKPIVIDSGDVRICGRVVKVEFQV